MSFTIGSYVEILEKPEGYFDVTIGTLGKVKSDKWLASQGIYCVDVFDSEERGCLNLNFEPYQLRAVTPEEISASPDWTIQREMLDEYEKQMTLQGIR
ncbi:MAG: hypothetical protein HY365_02705 [Candidatus Aenigmarchaeota archaeon]|nr:hypothetical protein [Candidatus Aenigmarchaeota archaeon]